MIVSSKLGCAFVKTRKTAGTSIEIALSAFCGPDDIITPISADDEQLRREFGGRGPQNLRPVSPMHYDARQWATAIRRRSRLTYRNHLSADAARRWLGRSRWDQMFTFAVDRNPWDRVLSLHAWRTRDDATPPSIDEFIRVTPAERLSNYHLYADRGGPIVDRVLAFEQLDEQLDDVRRQLGLPAPFELPRAKSGHRERRSVGRSDLSERSVERIQRVCAAEIELLGYEREP